jgi:uncharacterized protein (DUF1501 family)
MTSRTVRPDHGTDNGRDEGGRADGPGEGGCADGRRLALSRRGVLTGLGGTALLTAALGEAQIAFGSPAESRANVLVTVVLAGGLDGLSMVAPIGDPDYAPNRPGIALPASTAIQVDSRFGLHPALAPLYPLWTAGRFGAVHAVGQVSPTRSHIAAMDELERAAPGSGAPTGWLDRTLGRLPAGGPLEAVSLGRPGIPGNLRGPRPALEARRLDDVRLPVNAHRTPLPLWQRAISELHAGARAEVRAPMGSALVAIRRLGAKAPPPSPAAVAPAYPANGYGQGLKDIARLIKAGSGLRVATVQLGGWDTHVNHGNLDSGVFAPNLATLAVGLAAFASDLGPHFDRVTVITVTEFGRRVRQNGNNGLDHGHGSAMLLLGGGIDGGKVHGTWPGLALADLDSGLDLKATTDYRAVIAEILAARMGMTSVTDVFPGFSPAPVGVVRVG